MTQGGGESITIASYGVRVRVEIVDEATLAAVTERFPPGWTPIPDGAVNRAYRIARTDDSAVPYEVGHDGEGEARRFGTVEAALGHLEGEIQLYVAEFADPELFIHAGVVAWQGRAIVLPGSSFAGKSTLVTSLVEAGATYLSDEYAVFDEAGRVRPYPRRVSLRTGPHGAAAGPRAPCGG